MKIILYDPLFSEFGHFYRYSQFICKLLSGVDYVEEIIVIAESEKLKSLIEINPQKIIVQKLDSSVANLQTSSIQSSRFSKIWLYIKAFKNYLNVIRYINRQDADYVFLLSQGQLPFWLALKKLKARFIISSISIKWLYVCSFVDRVNSFFFKSALKSAHRVMFTEDIYDRKAKECGINTGFVFPDRFLVDVPTMAKRSESNVIDLVTLGTIAKGKSPSDFLSEFVSTDKGLRSKFKYTAAGKDIDGSMLKISAEIDSVKEVSFINDYLSGEEFSNLIERADFVVIPYSESYTRYATSGIMWDCFQRNKPILCPDIELFAGYINKYKIGYTYKEGQLENTLKQIIQDRKQFSDNLHQNYCMLVKNYSRNALSNKFKKLLNE